MEEHSVWLLSLWAWVTELGVEWELVPGFMATSTEQASEVTWGWWMSMAAVVTTQVVGSGTRVPARKEGSGSGCGGSMCARVGGRPHNAGLRDSTEVKLRRSIQHGSCCVG